MSHRKKVWSEELSLYFYSLIIMLYEKHFCNNSDARNNKILCAGFLSALIK